MIVNLLYKIKRLIIQGHYLFTHKATAERITDGLSQEDILESILNADHVRFKRSTSPSKQLKNEKICIIEGFTFDGLLVYTKGVIRKTGSKEEFYILISSKRSVYH